MVRNYLLGIYNKIFSVKNLVVLGAVSSIFIVSCADISGSSTAKQNASSSLLSSNSRSKLKGEADGTNYKNYEFDLIAMQKLDGWHQSGVKNAGINSQMLTFLPEQQTLSNWHESLVDSRIYILDDPKLTVNGLANDVIKQISLGCKQINTEQKNIQGYDDFLTVVGKGCKEGDKSLDEMHIVRIINQEDALYVLHYTIIPNKTNHDSISKMLNYVKNAKLILINNEEG